jgi:hypothetical protein
MNRWQRGLAATLLAIVLIGALWLMASALIFVGMNVGGGSI